MWHYLLLFLLVLIIAFVLYTGYVIWNLNTYKILSFNIEYGAAKYGVDKVVDIIKNSGADVAILTEVSEIDPQYKPIESKNTGKNVASKLGWNCVSVPSNDTVIISKYPLVVQNKDLGSALVNNKFYIIPVHLPDFPYQPFQVTKIPYCYDQCQKNVKMDNFGMGVNGVQSHNPDQELKLMSEATKARGSQMMHIIAEINKLKSNDNKPIIIGGDFNEPSHLDWSLKAFENNIHPAKVQYPTSSLLYANGFVDTYRQIYKDEVSEPGYTWPARMDEVIKDQFENNVQSSKAKFTNVDQKYIQDRIDFIYVTQDVLVRNVEKILTPSDHYALLASVSM